MYRSHVMVCGGTGCTSSNSDKIAAAFDAEISDLNPNAEVFRQRQNRAGIRDRDTGHRPAG